jgi:cGMP-dependent protein kinase
MNQFNYDAGVTVFEEKVCKLAIVLKGELIFVKSTFILKADWV